MPQLNPRHSLGFIAHFLFRSQHFEPAAGDPLARRIEGFTVQQHHLGARLFVLDRGLGNHRFAEHDRSVQVGFHPLGHRTQSGQVSIGQRGEQRCDPGRLTAALSEHRGIGRPRVQIDQIEVTGHARQRFDAVSIQRLGQTGLIADLNFVKGLIFDEVVHGCIEYYAGARR